MFFKTHAEGRIGYKQLTDADLGRGATTHQTHIGLFDDILTFLHNQAVEEQGLLIYNNTCTPLYYFFDRIETPNGSFRSPKIRKGTDGAASVVTVIRDLARRGPAACKWYLVWFGLESEMVVFYLFNDRMPDYRQVSTLIDLSRDRVKGRILSSQPPFTALVAYLEKIVNDNTSEILEQLEIASQIGNTSRTWRPFDIERATELFKTTGRRGEELVAQYLEQLKHQRRIQSFNWMNQSREAGLPFDFTIQYPNQHVVYADAKSTRYRFEQPMIFSDAELRFIHQTPHYHIYRVYGLQESANLLRICENSKSCVPDLCDSISRFKSELQQLRANLQSVKVEILPTLDGLEFSAPIRLGI